jgi:hypothetical protein
MSKTLKISQWDFSENHSFLVVFSILCFSLLKLNQIIFTNTSKDRAFFPLQNCIFRLYIKISFSSPIKVQCSKTYQKSFKFSAIFYYFQEKKCQNMFGPRIISYGFDRTRKAAQDALKKISQKYAHSTLIWSKRATSII